MMSFCLVMTGDDCPQAFAKETHSWWVRESNSSRVVVVIEKWVAVRR